MIITFLIAKIILGGYWLMLPDAVTVLAGVQAIGLLAAAITLLARNGKQRGSQSQELRTAKSSITR